MSNPRALRTPHEAIPGIAPVRARGRRHREDRRAQYFVVFEICCALALLVPGLSSLHSLVRMAALGGSIGMLALTRGGDWRHPAVIPAAIALLVIAFSIFNPSTNSLSAGLASIGLNIAIIAPLFWVPRLGVNIAAAWRVVLLLWAFYALSAAFGVLQTYFPGHFQPPLSAPYAGADISYLRSLMIETNNGMKVFRPMGLTDVPGGASLGGLYAVLLGMALFAREKGRGVRAVLAAGMVLGLAAIVLSLVRSVLLMVVLSVPAFFALLIARQLRRKGRVLRQGLRARKVRVARLATIVSSVLVLAIVLALSLSRKSVIDRYSTMFGKDQSQFYYSNRGIYLHQTVYDLLPKYPLGAGLGRWGMIYQYFGDRDNLDSGPMWVEIQWQGWMLDGGVPLILAYTLTLMITIWHAIQTALRRNFPAELCLLGALVFAYDLAALFVTFDYAFFAGQAGLNFWLVNGMLFAAARQYRREFRVAAREHNRRVL